MLKFAVESDVGLPICGPEGVEHHVVLLEVEITPLKGEREREHGSLERDVPEFQVALVVQTIIVPGLGILF